MKKEKKMTTKRMREVFREHTVKEGKAEFPPEYYLGQIKEHIKTLEKYLTRFPQMYEIRMGVKWPDKKPKIRDIARFVNNNRAIMVDDFIDYMMNKTHMSYDVYHKPEPIQWDMTETQYREYLNARPTGSGTFTKLGEFCFLILSEYIILHNLMWVSGLKPKGIKTIDTFLKEVR